jgi:hypothetical protein
MITDKHDFFIEISHYFLFVAESTGKSCYIRRIFNSDPGHYGEEPG